MPVARHQTDVDFPPVAASVPASRRFVTRQLADWGLDDLVEEAELLVSELVTNALSHAGTTVKVAINVDTRLTVCVTDERPDVLPAPRGDMVGPEAEEGRGLTLVALLSADWGVRRRPDSKTVWFALPVGGGAGG
jgi:anti-sigma regulatory factor (Ser/Thr protein kinase)